MSAAKLAPLLTLLSLMVVAGSAAAADISGRLMLGSYHPQPEQRKAASFNWELENGFKEVARDRVDAARELAVVLVGDGPSQTEDRVEVRFYGGALLPSTVVVRTGTTLLLRNDDEVAHELYAEGLDKLPAEAISPRGRRSVSLTEAGGWALHDRLIVHAHGYLHVLDDLVAVADVDPSGRFTFADVPPGKYTLKVFHGADELAAEPVEVGPKPLSVDPIALTTKAAPTEEAP